MARIAATEIERLRREVSLVRLVEARGVELRPRGTTLIGRCPFHESSDLSFVVSPAENVWRCDGQCQCGGSVIDLVMKADGVSFRHAVEILRDGDVLALAPLLAGDADDRTLLRQVVDYYHDALKESPEALSYLEIRGLRSAEMIDRFKLGFANRTLGYRLPAKRWEAGREIRGRLQRLGILRESGHEHFTGALVIPIFDEHGNVADMYGRKITAGLRRGTPLHLDLPRPRRGIWNAEALAASKEVILCEGLIDALTFWCAGFRNVTATYGEEGFTAAHLEALPAKRHRAGAHRLRS